MDLAGIMAVLVLVDVDGRPSVIDITTPLPFPAGLSISNSGNPDGGFVVYRVLIFRLGKCLRNEAMGPS